MYLQKERNIPKRTKNYKMYTKREMAIIAAAIAAIYGTAARNEIAQLNAAYRIAAKDMREKI